MLDRIVAAADLDSTVFPLPNPTRPKKPGSTSSRLRHRHRRKLAVWSAACGVVEVINGLSRGAFRRQTTARRPCSAPGCEVVAAWKRAHTSVLREAKCFAQWRRELAPTGVLAAAPYLGREPAEYSRSQADEAPREALRPLAVDEPSDDRRVEMLQVLSAEEAAYYAEESEVVDLSGKCHLLGREIEERYGFVAGTEEDYIRYLERPDVQRLWAWDDMRNIKAIAGFGVVPKKDPSRQRKLLMACAANYWWGDATRRRSHGLAGGDILGSLHVPSNSWSIAAFDEDNAFTRVETPQWMWQWFAGPPLLVGLVRHLLPPELHYMKDHEWAAPRYRRLPMGSSHSVHILMDINIATIGRHCALGQGGASPRR